MTTPTALAYDWLRKMTLDSFASITHYDPFIFMGVKLFGLCDPIDCQQREDILRAFHSSFGMMNSLVTQRSKFMFDTNDTIETVVPHFDLNGYLPKTITKTTYTASIAYPVPQNKTGYTDVATLTLTINALDATLHEQFYDALVAFDPLGCKRFGVAFLADPVLSGVTLTLKAHAFNFIDIDNIVDPANPPFLTTVDVVVSTIKDSVPLAYWMIDACGTAVSGAPCTYQTTEGCLLPTRYGEYDLRYDPLCYGSYPLYGNFMSPAKFSLSVVRLGVWVDDTWPNAMVSLANTLIPESYCSCNPLANERWQDDQGRGAKWEKTYRYSFWNPFGIASPGAQTCWKVMEMTLGSSVAWNG